MILILAFLTEDYGLTGFFPSYGDSVRLSLDYYSGSRYPLFVGCFKGFCLYAGTYGGFYRDSSFYLRDHVRVIDTIDVRRSSVQEWATLSRYFYSGRLLMGFEVGLVREIYSSVLRSYNEVFPDNRLSLGKERKGMLFGGVAGYGVGDLSGYFLFRYRSITRDSSISSGDTTGWVITVPSPPESDLELLLSVGFKRFRLNLQRRGDIRGYVRAEGEIRGFPYTVSVGYGNGPMAAVGMGKDMRGFRLMVGLAYVEALALGVGVRYPVSRR